MCDENERSKRPEACGDRTEATMPECCGATVERMKKAFYDIMQDSPTGPASADGDSDAAVSCTAGMRRMAKECCGSPLSKEPAAE